MGVVEDLDRAREAFDRGDWLAAYNRLSDLEPTEMTPADFANLATVAYLVGQQNDCVQALQRAYQAHLDSDDSLGAVRCAFWLARTLMMRGEVAVGSGWAGRAQALLDDEPDDVVERGYLLVLAMFGHIGAASFDAAREVAEEVEQYGRRFGDPDLVAMGIASRGRLSFYAGDVREGLSLLDEAMTALVAGEVSAVFAGDIYCLMIEGCQEISDLQRAVEWTAALSAWCDAQPGMVAYTGQCALHRGQIMRLHGALDQALVEFGRAVQRYHEAGTDHAAGLTWSERGDVHRIRGELDEAETAYERAAACGHEPQPGLALLVLARGQLDAAVGMARRLLAEGRNPVHRAQLLPGVVEILLAAGLIDEAATISSELATVAEAFGSRAVTALADYAAAGVALARDEPARAHDDLRRALRLWIDLGAPYETARCRRRLSDALHALGDELAATSELVSARSIFADLGARPAEREAAAVLRPSHPGGLSPREVEVLRLVASGKTNQQIAAALVLSEKTVARHLSNIFTKLDVSSRTAAAAYAFEHHLT